MEAPVMEHPPVVSTDWLEENLSNQSIIPVDSSWHMPATNRNGAEEFRQSLITGAVFFDIDQIADPESSLPHTIPSESNFASAVSNLGISNDDTLIIYQKGDIPTAARAWWMFRTMGHVKVYVLDGGFQKWTSENKPTTIDITHRTPTNYSATFNKSLFRDTRSLLENLSTKQEQIIDARAATRFQGTVEEPRPGLRAGHIPHAINLPFTNLYNSNNTLKTPKELQTIMQTAGINLDAPIVTSCGSGVTACNLAIAFAALGKWDAAVYDGSWTEWGSNSELPIET